MGHARAAKSPGSDEEPAPWVYFLAHRDWCDHILFYANGTYAHGALAGFGLWRLEQPGGRGLMLKLTLTHQGICPQHATEPVQEVLVSPDGSASMFHAGVAELRLVGPEALPLHGLEPQERRGLLFSSVGAQCLPIVRDHWLGEPAAASFDVALAYYGEEQTEAYGGLLDLEREHRFVEVHKWKGIKWPNFRRWIQSQGGAAVVAARYDYVWVVDDDVRLCTQGINELFAQLRAHPSVQFACPSFDAASEGVWRYFDRHDPRYRLRYTDFVECTAPVLKTSMLLDSLFDRCLNAAYTGCFLDFCFHPVCGVRPKSVAIIDAVQCHHPLRDESTPSELRALLPWEEHRRDSVHFEKAGLPSDWWWFRKPVVLSGEPSDGLGPKGTAASSLRARHCTEATKPAEAGPSHALAAATDPLEGGSSNALAAAADPWAAAVWLLSTLGRPGPQQPRPHLPPGPTSAEDALRKLAERAASEPTQPAAKGRLSAHARETPAREICTSLASTSEDSLSALSRDVPATELALRPRPTEGSLGVLSRDVPATQLGTSRPRSTEISLSALTGEAATSSLISLSALIREASLCALAKEVQASERAAASTAPLVNPPRIRKTWQELLSA